MAVDARALKPVVLEMATHLAALWMGTLTSHWRPILPE